MEKYGKIISVEKYKGGKQMKLSVSDLKSFMGIPQDQNIVIVWLTPDMADTILAENNDHNRKMNMTGV